MQQIDKFSSQIINDTRKDVVKIPVNNLKASENEMIVLKSNNLKRKFNNEGTNEMSESLPAKKRHLW